MTIIFECDGKTNWKPGIFRSQLGKHTFRRVWWAWFAITLYSGDLKEYGEAAGHWVDE